MGRGERRKRLLSQSNHPVRQFLLGQNPGWVGQNLHLHFSENMISEWIETIKFSILVLADRANEELQEYVKKFSPAALKHTAHPSDGGSPMPAVQVGFPPKCRLGVTWIPLAYAFRIVTLFI